MGIRCVVLSILQLYAQRNSGEQEKRHLAQERKGKQQTLLLLSTIIAGPNQPPPHEIVPLPLHSATSSYLTTLPLLSHRIA